MVTVNDYIAGSRRPVLWRSRKYNCDRCGAECQPLGYGMHHELLYEYEGEQLCWKCLDELLWDTADYAVVSE